MTKTEANKLLWETSDQISLIFRHVSEKKRTRSEAASVLKDLSSFNREYLAKTKSATGKRALREACEMYEDAATRMKNGYLW